MIYGPYKAKCYYYELVNVGRRGFYVLILTQLDGHPRLQSIAANTMATVLFALHVKLQPYAELRRNDLDDGLLFALVLLCAASLIFGTERYILDSQGKAALAAEVVANCALAWMAILLLAACGRHISFGILVMAY